MSSHELPELDDGTRSLLDAARDMHEPSPQVQARVFRDVELKIAAGITTTAIAGSWFLGTAKAMFVVAALGVASAGVWYANKPAPSTPERVRSQPAAIPAPAPAPVSQVVESEDAGPPAKRRVRRERRVDRTSLVAETRLLKDVNAAINRRDGAHAMKLLGEYDRRFGGGLLREERSAARVLSLCLVGKRGSALREARRFEAEFPRSPLLSRVHGSCVDESSP